jgi:hypothetical protein
MVTKELQPDRVEPGRLARILPILKWAPAYERRWLGRHANPHSTLDPTTQVKLKVSPSELQLYPETASE